MATTIKSKLRVQEQDALVGIEKYLSNVTQVTVEGAPYAVADLKKALTDDLAAQTATAAARAASRAAVAAERITGEKAHGVLLLLHAYVVYTYGKNAAQVYSDFGFPQPKTGKKTVQVKAQAIEKSRATRAARHTLGSKQRRAIHGTPPATSGGASGNGSASK